MHLRPSSTTFSPPPLPQTPAEVDEVEAAPVEMEEDEDASVLAAAVYHVMSATNTLLDNEGSLVEHEGIPPRPEDHPTDSDNLAYAITLSNPSSPATPAACASASHVPQDLLLDTACMIGPSQCCNEGHPAESNGEPLLHHLLPPPPRFFGNT